MLYDVGYGECSGRMRELLVFPLSGCRYGIWKDEVASLREVGELHVMPFASSLIAGAAEIDGKTVALADIGACIGLPLLEKTRGVTALLASFEGELFGCAVGGGTETVSIPPEACAALPERVRTQAVGSCAVTGSAVIPIISFSAVRAMVLSTDSAPGLPALAPRSRKPSHARESGGVQLLAAGGFLFAMDAEGVIQADREVGAIIRLPHLPSILNGVRVSSGRVLPVVDLTGYMSGRPCGAEAVLVVAADAEDAVGLLVDEDRGAVRSKRGTVSELPLLVKTDELPAAVRTGSGFALFLDPPMLFSDARRPVSAERPPSSSAAGSRARAAADLSHPWHGRTRDPYAPDSRFSSIFLDETVKVVEFEAGGMRHAVPAAEVEDVVPYRTVHPLPKASRIVRGVADLDGDIVPVLDLACVYARRTDIDPRRKMIAIRNGTFRALLAAEAILPERGLNLEMQKPLPVTPPFGILYGCYTDGIAVRLILNIEALAVNFDDSEVADFLSDLPLAESEAEPAAEIEQAAPVPEPEPAAPAVAAAEADPSAPPESPPAPEPPLEVERAAEMTVEAEPVEELEPVAPETVAEAEPVEYMEPAASEAAAAAVEPAAFVAPIPAVEPTAEVEPAAEPEPLPAEVEPATEPAQAAEPRSEKRKRGVKRPLSAALISGPIMAALILIAVFVIRSMGVQHTTMEPVNPATIAVVPEPQAAVVAQPEAAPPLLELVVPDDVPLLEDVYIVVKGDTLWDIAKRFTGNPWACFRIAGENAIADPDLIYPGQMIKLIKKKK
jgi:chemotaxis signal transduction protein/nucleoid-associated protein YgaU